ncbi:MAG TPA: hypothetical protein VM598_07455, partial [Bdellovibrionota bacterium]|nr:hypothetical protein [Bdellovibrionota bacterium]
MRHPRITRRQALGSIGTLVGSAALYGCTAKLNIRSRSASLARPGTVPPPAPSPSATPGPDLRGVLKPEDFTYLGAMKMPLELTGGALGTLAARKVGGELRFFSTGSYLANSPVFEFPYVGHSLDFAAAPRSRVIQEWGDIYQGKKATWSESGERTEFGGNVGLVSSLLFHQNRLYWTYINRFNYELGGSNDFCLGMTDLRGGPGAMLSYGPWQFDGSADPLQVSQNLSGYLLHLPSGKLGIGGGMWGPALRELEPPGDSTPGGFGSSRLRGKKHLEYTRDPWPLGAGGTIPAGAAIKRFRRDNGYVWKETAYYTQNIDPNTTPKNQGYWTHVDSTNGAVWIDLPDKKGVLWFGDLATGNVWDGYGNENGGDACTNGEFG